MMRDRLARLERLMGDRLTACPSCRRRLAGGVPVKHLLLAENEPIPPADQCPGCGAEWPMLTVETVSIGPFLVMGPLPYDPTVRTL